MLRSVVSRYGSGLLVMALSFAVSAGSPMAQMQQPSPPTSGVAPPVEKAPAEQSTMGIVEGSVTKVDPATRSVQVSTGLFGLLGRTLQVNDQTQIQVEGRQGTLADVREGAKVKASYEARDGKKIANRIEIMPSVDQPGGAGVTRPGPGALDLGTNK